MINNFFKKAVGLGVATALAFSVATAPVMAEGYVSPLDYRNEETEVVQGLAQRKVQNFEEREGKNRPFVYVVHVGEEKMWHAVHKVALYMNEQGNDVEVYLAQDIDNIPNTTYVQIYHDDNEVRSIVGFAHQNISTFQQAVYQETMNATQDALTVSVNQVEYNN